MISGSQKFAQYAASDETGPRVKGVFFEVGFVLFAPGG